MKILFSSDLHFGFTARTYQLHKSLFKKGVAGLDFDAIVIAGDLGTSKITHFETACRFLRKMAGARPVIIVLGNHDFWDPSIKQFSYLKARIERIVKKYNIISLQTLIDNKQSGLSESGAFKLNDVAFVGYNGWYTSPFPPTNDGYYIPGFGGAAGSNYDLYQQAEMSIQIVASEAENLKDNGFKVVVMTHFGTFKKDPYYNKQYGGETSHFDMIDGKADLFLFGHSHYRLDLTTEKGTRVINAGADYDIPRYKIVEI